MSNFAAWQIAELRRAAADHAVPDPVIAQQVYNVVATRIDDEYAEYARTTGIPTVVYNPLAGGLLTGKHTRQQPPAAGGSAPPDSVGCTGTATGTNRLPSRRRPCGPSPTTAGLSMAELALRWTIDRPVVDAVLIGGSRPENIRTNLAAIAKGPLPADLADAVTAVSTTLHGPMPAYNR